MVRVGEPQQRLGGTRMEFGGSAQKRACTVVVARLQDHVLGQPRVAGNGLGKGLDGHQVQTPRLGVVAPEPMSAGQQVQEIGMVAVAAQRLPRRPGGSGQVTRPDQRVPVLPGRAHLDIQVAVAPVDPAEELEERGVLHAQVIPGVLRGAPLILELEFGDEGLGRLREVLHLVEVGVVVQRAPLRLRDLEEPRDLGPQPGGKHAVHLVRELVRDHVPALVAHITHPFLPAERVKPALPLDVVPQPQIEGSRPPRVLLVGRLPEQLVKRQQVEGGARDREGGQVVAKGLHGQAHDLLELFVEPLVVRKHLPQTRRLRRIALLEKRTHLVQSHDDAVPHPAKRVADPVVGETVSGMIGEDALEPAQRRFVVPQVIMRRADAHERHRVPGVAGQNLVERGQGLPIPAAQQVSVAKGQEFADPTVELAGIRRHRVVAQERSAIAEVGVGGL